MRILICPDKFKGSLSAKEAAEAIAAGVKSARPGAETVQLPIADGGEGTAEILVEILKGQWRHAVVEGPNGDPVRAGYGMVWSGTEKCAVIEMSRCSGLLIVPPDQRDPLRASTYGTGQLLMDAISAGAKRIILGIGGSATTDGGMGMAAALGYRFLDRESVELEPRPYNLGRIASIERGPSCALPPVKVACDVENPLLGPQGAAAVFGPQKGIRQDQIAFFEEGLRNLADICARHFAADHRDTPGAGAAGGLGFGLLTFAGAKLFPGFDLIAEACGLREALSGVDVVITGEGSLDAQSSLGKGPVRVAQMASRERKRCFALAGRWDGTMFPQFEKIVALSAVAGGAEESMREARAYLEAEAARLASTF
jgi:glycerate kinase